MRLGPRNEMDDRREAVFFMGRDGLVNSESSKRGGKAPQPFDDISLGAGYAQYKISLFR